jgi:two-component system OmpR family sensor kinase
MRFEGSSSPRRRGKPRLRFIQYVPIRWRLVFLSLGLLTLLLSGLGVTISLIAGQVLVANEVNVLQNEAHVAMKGVMKNVRPQDRPFEITNHLFPPGSPPAAFNLTASSLLHALSSPATNTYATMLTPGGEKLLANSQAPSIAPKQVQQIMQTATWYLLAKDAQGQRQLIVFIPLVANFHTVALLQINTSTAPIDNFLAPFHLTLFLGILGALCLAIALIFPLVSVALRPLVEIEQTSRRIAQGELSMRIAAPPMDDEIGRLARSFNHMVAQLEAAFQRQKHFVADASHELRTPLTALSGSLEMLLIGADQGNIEAARHLTRGMYAEVQRMNRMVEDLLVLTRLDDGKIALRQGSVDVGAVLSAVCEQAKHLAHGQELRCLVEPALPSIRADKDRLQQVVLNLVENALKFTPADGQVELQASHAQHTVVITISDTGLGISPEALPHVFERFYRADSARSRSPQQKGGNGLGLAIAKELIEAQGGTIDISSTPGQGTTVTICFLARGRLKQPEGPEKLAQPQETAQL